MKELSSRNKEYKEQMKKDNINYHLHFKKHQTYFT